VLVARWALSPLPLPQLLLLSLLIYIFTYIHNSISNDFRLVSGQRFQRP
jgi:hypothetical protein